MNSFIDLDRTNSPIALWTIFRLWAAADVDRVSNVLAWKRIGPQLARLSHRQRCSTSTLEMRPHGLAIRYKLRQYNDRV